MAHGSTEGATKSWSNVSLSLLKCKESLLPRSKNFSSQQNFLIQMITTSIREHDADPMKSLLKNISLSLSGCFPGNWRFSVENWQCLCNMSLQTMLSLWISLSLCVCVSLSVGFERPSAVLAAVSHDSLVIRDLTSGRTDDVAGVVTKIAMLPWVKS